RTVLSGAQLHQPSSPMAMRFVVSFVTRSRPTRSQRRASSRSWARSMMRPSCKPRLGPPMPLSMRPAPGIRSVVLCNSLIYGNALGPPARSVQIPALVAQAKASGIARYIGRGLNRWSNVHIADVAALYALVLTRARAGTFMYVESGEDALGEIVRAIAARLGLGAAQSWSAEEAIAAWGRNMAVFSLGSNSRVRGKTAADLGWSPRRRSVTQWIADELV